MEKTKQLVLIALFSAIICVSSLISIPIGAVPISLQSLAIMIAGLCLKPKEAASSVLVYILIGAVGIPVFAGAKSGVGVLVGPTGGYIVGFLVGAFVISKFVEKKFSLQNAALGLFLGGLVVVYLIGVCWLCYQTNMPIEKAIKVGMLIFIPGDLFKMVIAYAISSRIRKQI